MSRCDWPEVSSFGGLEDHNCVQSRIASVRLDASRPGADRGIAAAVGMQNRERVGRARVAANSHEDATPGRQRLENASIVVLEPGTTHRGCDPELREIV